MAMDDKNLLIIVCFIRLEAFFKTYVDAALENIVWGEKNDFLFNSHWLPTEYLRIKCNFVLFYNCLQENSFKRKHC